MKKIICFLMVYPLALTAQVVITENTQINGAVVTDPSAALEIRHDKKGLSLPEAPLKSVTDAVTVPNPVEGLAVVNTTVNSISNPDIPVKRPAMTVWDGSKWLFYYTKYDNNASLDLVKTFVSKNINTVVFTNFPSTSPAAVKGEPLGGAWRVLVNSDTASNGEPYFDYTNANAAQTMVVDAEGMATINSGGSDAFSFNYEVGIFVENKLVAAKKFFKPIIVGASCSYSKYNITAIIKDPAIFNKAPGEYYNVKLAVRPLVKPTGSNYTRLVFGDNAGGTCGNLTLFSAQSYMDVTTVEKRN